MYNKQVIPIFHYYTINSFNNMIWDNTIVKFNLYSFYDKLA